VQNQRDDFVFVHKSCSWLPQIVLNPLYQFFLGSAAVWIQISLVEPSAAFLINQLLPSRVEHTFCSQCLNSSTVHFPGSPFGSSAAGNISLPQIIQAEAAATTAPKPITAFYQSSVLLDGYRDGDTVYCILCMYLGLESTVDWCWHCYDFKS
jgi:hypothetical protein